MPGCALPEHSQQKCCKQRSVHEGEHELQKIHDVIEASSGVRCGYRKRDSEYGRHSTYPEIVLIACPFVDVGLVDVVGPDGFKCRPVPRHTGHETSKQSRYAQ